jgi:hypothetical protein
MRDVHHRDAKRPLNMADLLAHFLPQLRVEVRQRLVHQAHRRLGDDRAAQRNALLLAAGKLRGLAIEKLGEPEKTGDALQPRLALLLRDLAHAQPEDDVLGDGKMRKQRIRLEHHRDVALRRRQLRHVAPADENAALIRRLETGDQAQGRRFAAARRPEQNIERAFVEREREPIDRANLSFGGRPVLAYVFDGDRRHA